MTIAIVAAFTFFAGLLIGAFISSGRSSTPLDQQTLKDIAMAVYAELTQPPLAALDAAFAALPDKVAAAVAAGSPEAAADKADILTAVETSLAGATAAINAVGGA